MIIKIGTRFLVAILVESGLPKDENKKTRSLCFVSCEEDENEEKLDELGDFQFCINNKPYPS